MARVRYVSFKSFNVIVLVEKDMRGFHLACGMGHINRSWRISTTPNTTKIFLIIFKLIQESIMVILSCLARKNQNLNSRKKTSVYYWELHFQGRNACKLPFLVINWFFFPRIQILSFLRETTQNAHNSLLYKFENDQKNFGCLGSCGYAPASVE